MITIAIYMVFDEFVETNHRMKLPFPQHHFFCAMQTQLAAQLQKIRVEGADKIDISSILFSPSDASKISLSSIYSMARNGVMELIRVDNRFQRFEETLFGNKFLTVNRFHITPKENEEINKIIRDYLFSVSPYMSLKCVQKTLEYLIRRLSIHTFNAEDFFIAVLPYHESPLFPRVYRILDMKSHLFDFLSGVKRSETPIIRSTLSTQCLKDIGFLNFILNSYRCMQEHHSIPVAHLTLLCAMVVDMGRSGTMKEEYIRALISFASLGLSSSNSEFQATGFLILAQIAINVTLSNDVITACLNNSFRVKDINMTQLVECLLIITRNNHDYVIPQQTAEVFLQNETLQISLQSLSKKASIFPIVKALAEAHVALLCENESFLQQLRLLSQCMHESEVNQFLQIYLQALSQMMRVKKMNEKEVNNVEKALLVLSSEFSEPFDVLLSAIPMEDPLKQVSSRLFFGSSHMLLRSGRTLYLSIDTHEYAVRKEVCELVKEQLENVNAETSPKERSFLKNSLLSLLEDDFMDISLQVLQIPLEQLLYVFEEKEVVDMVFGVLQHEKVMKAVQEEAGERVIQAAFSLLDIASLDEVFEEKPVQVVCLFYQYMLTCKKPIQRSILAVMDDVPSPFCQGLQTSFCEAPLQKQVSQLASSLESELKEENKCFFETCRQLLRTSQTVAVFFIYTFIQLIQTKKESSESKLLASLLCEFATSVLEEMPQTSSVQLKVKEADVKSLPASVNSSSEYVLLLLHSILCCATLLPWDTTDLIAHFDEFVKEPAHPLAVLCFCFRSFAPQKSFIMVLANLICGQIWKEQSFIVYTSLLACSNETNIIVHSLNKLLSYVTLQKTLSSSFFNPVLLALVCHLNNPALTVRSTALMLLDAIRSRIPQNASLPLVSSGEESSIPLISTGEESSVPSEELSFSVLSQLVNYLLSIRSEIRDDPKLFTIKLNLLFTSSKPKINPSLLASVLYPLILSCKSLHQRVSYLQLFEKMPYHPVAEKEVLQVCNDTFKAFMEIKETVSPLLVQQWRLLMPLFFEAMAHTFTHQQEFRDTLYLFMSTPLSLSAADGTFTPLTDVLRNINKKIFASMNTPEKLSLLQALLSVVPNHPSVDAVDVYNSINELDLSVALLSEEAKALANATMDDYIVVQLMTGFIEVVTRNEKLSRDVQIIDPLLIILNRLVQIVKLNSSTKNTVPPERKRAKASAMEVESASTSDSHLIMSDMLAVLYPIQILLECLFSIVNAATSDIRVTSTQTLQAADPSQPPSKRVRRNSISIRREVAIPPQLIVDLINLNLTTQIKKTCLQLLTVLSSIHSEEMDRHLFACFDSLAAKVIQNQDEEAFNVIISILSYCLNQFTNQTQLLRIYKTFLSCVPYIPYSQIIHLLNTLIAHSSMRYIGHITAYLLLLSNGYDLNESSVSSKDMEVEHEVPMRIENSAVANSNINHFITSMFLGIGLLPQIQALSVLCCFSEIITEGEQEEKKESRMRELTQALLQSLPIASWKKDASNSIHIGQVVLNFMRNIVSNSTFIGKVASAKKDIDKIQQFFIQIIENLLMILQNTTASRDLIGQKARGHAKTEQQLELLRGYRELENCVYDCVTVFAEVMTVPSLLTVLSVLLKHEDSGIRKRALVMLNKKISDNIETLSKEEQTDFLHFIDNLLEIVRDSQEQSANKQTALLSLHILVQYFGSEHPQEFQPVVTAILSIVTRTDVTSPDFQALKGSAYIALSMCCTQLGVRMLPFLPRFLPSLLTELDTSASRCDSLREEIQSLEEKHDEQVIEERRGQLDEVLVLIQSLVATLSSAVSFQGSLLSSYLQRIICLVLRPMLVASDKQVVRGAVSVLLTLLAEKIEPRLLLPAIYSSFKELGSHVASSYCGLFSLLESLFHHMEESQIAEFYERAWSFCVSGLELRTRWGDENEGIDDVERSVVKAMIALTLKLNENQLSPLFVKTVNWMQEKSVVQSEENAENALPPTAKAIAFFTLVSELSNTFKSIFTSYFGQFFSSMVDLLSDFVKKTRKEKEVSSEYIASFQLIKLVVLSLYRCFLYDSDGWMDEAKFKLVSSPLVKLLGAYFIPNYATEYPKFMSQFVVPTLIQLVVSTAGHDDWWQQFNHEVLVQTRSPIKDVKLAAMRVIRECFERMSQEYLPLLPDVIPFLADLLEDEDAEVEKAAQDLRVQLESISGEELTSYLTM